ncbi:MAG: PEP/pyruvate-binding domain-containing protein [Myxococcales bacterium]
MGRQKNGRLVIPVAAFALGLAFGAGCSKGPCTPCGTDSLTMSVDGFEPESFEVRLDLGGAAATVLDCPGEAKTGRHCLAKGVQFDASPAQLTATVKCPGAHYLQAKLTPTYQETPASCGCDHAVRAASSTLTVKPLSPFVANQDYRTGFTKETGLDDFLAMAYASPSELGQTLVVKFYIDQLQTDSPEVYFQNTRLHPIHYDFVHTVLGRAISQADFEAATYHGAGRTGMAGNVIFYLDRAMTSGVLGASVSAPFTVEFFPTDDLTPEQALLATRLLHERMLFVPLSGSEHRLFYLPAGSRQQSELLASRAGFDAWGEPFLTREELYGDLTVQLLNPGVAFGTLRTVTPEQLQSSAVSFHDVVVLPRLPNEIPIVGGTISVELQTPLAHVNLAARARGTPNLALTTALTDSRVAPLMGKLVRFEVTRQGFSLREATLAEATAFWDSRTTQPKVTPESDCTRTALAAFGEFGFADAIAYGVKASNLSEMSKVVPEQTPQDGFAVPFHYYDAFISTAQATSALCDAARTDCVATRAAAVCDQARTLCLPEGATSEALRDQIHRLLGDATFVTDSPVREAALANLRYLFANVPVDPAFGQALDARVAERMGTAKVKLRSSTNAEDLPHFTGAGLYDSFGAQASGEKAASSRIRLVWASAWNWRAFEERAFWNIDQEAIRMAVLVNPSFQDEEANGVVVTQNLANPAVVGMYVNVQKGEWAVTNPTDGALPEVFSIIFSPSGLQVARERFSSLSPDAPLMTEDEVRALYQTANKVQGHFAPLYKIPASELKLDIEFKLRAGDRALMFKQVRPYYESTGL